MLAVFSITIDDVLYLILDESFYFQPHLSRLFGKKDNSSNIMPMQYKDVEKLLETEKSRCRRLQDQLSQSRAEVVALQRESKSVSEVSTISLMQMSSITVEYC